MAGKLILVKTDDILPCLCPVTAEHVDMESGMVWLSRPIDMKCGPTRWVPLGHCFEFDADLMDQINTLYLTAHDRLAAATELSNNLRPVVFDLPESEMKPEKSH